MIEVEEETEESISQHIDEILEEVEEEVHVLNQEGIEIRTGVTITNVTITNVTPPTADEFSEAEEPVANFELQNTGVAELPDDFVTIADGTATWTMEETPETEVNDNMIDFDEAGSFPTEIRQIRFNDAPEVINGTHLHIGTGGEITHNDFREVFFNPNNTEETNDDSIIATGLALQSLIDDNGNFHNRAEEESGYGFTDDESQILNYGR